VEFEFVGVVIHWRGPSPFHFVAVPGDVADAIRSVANEVTYGWGVIPATVVVGATRFTTSLFPKDGGYLVPLKDVVRKRESIAIGDGIHIHLTLGR
jgi:hypothetical protein